MWITLGNEKVNFDLVLRFRREEKILYVTDITNSTRMIYYKTDDKAKQVEDYLLKVLNSNLVINSEINEPNNLY